MKAMVMGLRPYYYYPGTLAKWGANNTLNAANMGAAFICRSLLRQFDATYVEQFDDIAALNRDYDVCILALATHVHPRRDVSFFADIAEQLTMPVYAFSLGITDEVTEAGELTLHPSVHRLLSIVAERTRWIGVRGPHTAAVLERAGFANVVPIGCPSLYWNRTRDFRIEKPAASPERTAFVYHWMAAVLCAHQFRNVPIVAQDFLDQPLFTDELPDDKALRDYLDKRYASLPGANGILGEIARRGVFFREFADWLSFLCQHQFIFGPRLHGCLASLAHGIPALLTPRDLRVREVAEFFSLPFVPLAELEGRTIPQLYDACDFSAFNAAYPGRFDNYRRFLAENRLEVPW
jgi:hypothetical protein